MSCHPEDFGFLCLWHVHEAHFPGKAQFGCISTIIYICWMEKHSPQELLTHAACQAQCPSFCKKQLRLKP